jgi:hypothetical protein
MPESERKDPHPEVGKIQCQLCSEETHFLPAHLRRVHGLSVDSYREKFPESPTVSFTLWERYREGSPSAPSRPRAKVQFGPISVRVHEDVPEGDCLPCPEHFRFPTAGDLREIAEDISVSLSAGRSIFLWGLPGVGKDALFHAYSAITQRPAEIFDVRPDTNIREWFYVRGFDKESSTWEEGKMLRICRDGYQTEAGERIPYLVLITDFDRAGRVQAESIRLLTDTIQGRVKGPGGTTYPVLPGTQFCLTANTSGAGDARGRCISANPIDASIMARINRKYHYTWMDWSDESWILTRKFPELCQEDGVLDTLKSCTEVLHGAMESEEFYGEFSHRELCAWLEHSTDLQGWFPELPNSDLLARSARCWLDGLPDEESRMTAIRLIDPYTGIRAYLDGGETERGPSDSLQDYLGEAP